MAEERLVVRTREAFEERARKLVIDWLRPSALETAVKLFVATSPMPLILRLDEDSSTFDRLARVWLDRSRYEFSPLSERLLETRRPASPEHEESRAQTLPHDLETIKKERDDLFVQNQVLQSRVNEERQSAARAIREGDQLRASLDRLVSCVNERAKANDSLQGILVARQAGRLRMFESYDGVVEQIHGDHITVVFETSDDFVQQTYERTQFMEGKLPNVGDRLTVFVHVAVKQSNSASDQPEQATPTGKDNESPKRGRNAITGPYEF